MREPGRPSRRHSELSAWSQERAKIAKAGTEAKARLSVQASEKGKLGERSFFPGRSGLLSGMAIHLEAVQP